MFNNAYKFVHHTYTKETRKGYEIKTHILSFDCKHNQSYLVTVEEYSFDIYSIKFCLKNHQHSKNRFNYLTGFFDAAAIIKTCLDIMLFYLDKNKIASFGFIGSNSIDEKLSNTKRFKLYKRVMGEFISPTTFHHFQSKKHSAYIMINLENKTHNLIGKIEKMFKELYVLDSEK